MKKLIIGIIVVGLVFLICLLAIDRKVYYLALGDSLAVGMNAYNEESYGYTNQISDYFKSKIN
jgi:lysophospholipase L1-like esterase